MSVDVEHFIWSNPLEYIVRLNFVFRGLWREQLIEYNDRHGEDPNTTQRSPSKERTRKHGRTEVRLGPPATMAGHSLEEEFMIHDDPTTPSLFVRSSSNAP